MATGKKRKSIGRRIGGAVLYAAVCGSALAGGVFFGVTAGKPVVGETLAQLIWNVQPEDVFRDTSGPKNQLVVLILGVDTDVSNKKTVTNEAARSDMMMLARLDFKENTITGLSIPRDILMKMPDTGKTEHRINAFHRIGGKPLAQKAVEELTGVKIDRTVTLNFDGLQGLVERVGGIELNVPKDMKYTDNWGGLFIDLKAGYQHLNGYEAMGFVRFRHDDNDVERQKRQREFMLAYQKKLMQNPQFVPGVLQLASEQTKETFSEREFAALLNFAISARSGNIQLDTIPVLFPGRGKSYLLADQRKMPEVLRKYGFEQERRMVNTIQERAF